MTTSIILKKLQKLVASSNPDVALDNKPKELTTGGEGYKVVLFNDEVHSVDQVVMQLLRALRCSVDTAVEIMWRAHSRGRAIVTISDHDEAHRVTGILREIALKVTVEHV